ncbi:MAG: hypothetical protein JSV90_06295 [Methanobacteriota archaeon]|nr:MAG: hypothetical protein JSV90_06295 [Euryarchaeota archaeon]
MTDEISQQFKADVAAISTEPLEGSSDENRVKRLVAQVFLRLWTRLALETGRRLRMNPSQFAVGTYKGKMSWAVNEGCLDALQRVELGDDRGKGYMLVAEVYEFDDEIRTRIFFSLQEDEVKGEAVYVNYLVADMGAKDFSPKAVADSMQAVLPKWAEALMSGDDGPLVSHAKEHFECVGV